ncbi:MAG: baseplate J/gp47 family protein [Elainellaceae cyanobacterium]
MTLNPPKIDKRNERELTTQAKRRTFQRSQGKLNDFSNHSPLDVFIRTQAFAGAELLYQANKLPLAFALKFLELTDVERKLGSKATVKVTFTLTSARPGPYEIPAGFEVTGSFQGKTYSFFTDEQLIITAGDTTGSANAAADSIGSSYNLPAGIIDTFTQPLNFLDSVINPEAAKGGADEESEASYIQRATAALRVRSLVSESDFEEVAEGVLGLGSRAKAIGLLSLDKSSLEPGAVHVFCLAPDGTPANLGQLAKVEAEMSPRKQLGTRLHISPMELINIKGHLIARLQDESSPTEIADGLWKAFEDYFSPSQFNPGDSVLIREVEHELRFAGGLEYIEQLKLNDQLQNIPMPNKYTLPNAYSLSMQLVASDGNVFEIGRGEGESENFDPQV